MFHVDSWTLIPISRDPGGCRDPINEAHMAGRYDDERADDRIALGA